MYAQEVEVTSTQVILRTGAGSYLHSNKSGSPISDCFELISADDFDWHNTMRTWVNRDLTKSYTVTRTVGGDKFYVCGNGTVWSYNNNFYSDLRLKKNNNHYTGAFQKINLLEAKTYQWKDDEQTNPRYEIGLIAQDVEKYYPNWSQPTNTATKPLIMSD